jgi:Uma2 family endonuclease
MSSKIAKRLFTRAEYHRMAEAGILKPNDRVELIEGELIEMPPIGIWHASCVDRLNRLLVTRLGRSVIVRVQGPVALGTRSEPQPDLTVLHAEPAFYATRHPEAADVAFLVEVADTSAPQDRKLKIPMYAQSRVAEVWLVDRTGGYVEVYRTPSLRTYRDVTRATRGERISPLAFPKKSFRVSEILG